MENKHDNLKCEAPICATYPTESLVWFPDEKICGARPLTRWQENQKKIAKLAKENDRLSNSYFTVEMLEKLERVKKGIVGKHYGFNVNQEVAKLDVDPPRKTVFQKMEYVGDTVGRLDTFEGVAASF